MFVFFRPCMKQAREPLLERSCSILLIIHFPFSKTQCRCQLMCRWLLVVSVHFPSIYYFFISINVNDSTLKTSVLIHLLDWIDRVNDFCFVNRMENILCVCVYACIKKKNWLKMIETNSLLINTFCAHTKYYLTMKISDEWCEYIYYYTLSTVWTVKSRYLLKYLLVSFSV